MIRAANIKSRPKIGRLSITFIPRTARAAIGRHELTSVYSAVALLGGEQRRVDTKPPAYCASQSQLGVTLMQRTMCSWPSHTSRGTAIVQAGWTYRHRAAIRAIAARASRSRSTAFVYRQARCTASREHRRHGSKFVRAESLPRCSTVLPAASFNEGFYEGFDKVALICVFEARLRRATS